MKKVIAIIIVISLLFSTAYGAAFKVISNGEIEYYGTTEKNKTLGVMVFKVGKNYSDIIKGADSSDVLAAYKECTADDNGNFTLKFKLTPGTAPSGLYGILYSDGSGVPVTNVIYYVNKTQYEQKTAGFADSRDQAAYIVENVYDMGLEPELVNNEIASGICSVYNASVGMQTLSISDTTDYLNKSAAINAFNNDKIRIFGEYEDYFAIDSDLYDFINKQYVSDIKSKTESKMKHNSSSIKAFDQNLTEAYVLACVECADGYGDVELALSKYGNTMGIDTDKVNAYVCKKIIGNSYSVDSLKYAIDDFYKESKADNKKGSSGGGGSGVSSPKIASVSLVPESAADLEPYVEQPETFSDLSGYDWAIPAIENLSQLKIVRGRDTGKFCPEQNVLREEFVKMIIEAIKFSDLSGEFNMQDVNPGDWYYPYVRKAYLAGVVNGISKDTFGSGLNITRQDMSVILYNALRKKGVKMLPSYEVKVDLTDVSDYALEAVEALAGCGVVHGDAQGRFNSKAYTTRAEAAVIINNALEYMGGNGNE